MKKLICFALILSVLLFSGCGETTEVTDTMAESEAGVKVIKKQPLRQETWFDRTCKEQCKEDIGCFNSCMNRNAVIEQDSSLCEAITASLFKERCKDNVLMRKATTTNDISFCQQMQDEKIKQNCNNKLTS